MGLINPFLHCAVLFAISSARSFIRSGPHSLTFWANLYITHNIISPICQYPKKAMMISISQKLMPNHAFHYLACCSKPCFLTTDLYLTSRFRLSISEAGLVPRPPAPVQAVARQARPVPRLHVQVELRPRAEGHPAHRAGGLPPEPRGGHV